MIFTKLLTSCKEKWQEASNQAFIAVEKGAPNVRGRSQKWIQMSPSKTNEHKDANENHWEAKAAPREMQMKTSEKKKQHHAKLWM